MQTRIDISPEILDWLIKNIPSESMSDKALSSIKLWKNGDSKPTFNQLENFSKTLGIPFGYFFLQTPPLEDLSLVEYRTIDSIDLEQPSRNLIDTMHDMEQIQDWMYNYLISIESNRLSFVGEQNGQTNTSIFASYIRKILGLSIDWFKASKSTEESFNIIRTAISNAGVIVMMSGIVGNNTHRSLKIDEFRAFALVNDYAPLIFINSNDSINGKIFSLLHEFVHICIGENSLFNDRYSTGQKIKKTEVICNAVSAELLVPINMFIDEWAKMSADYDDIEIISLLAKRFKCGETVIARRALDQKYITFQRYNEISKQAVRRYNDNQKRKKENGETGGDYYRTAASRIDKRFLGMLLSSVHEGTTLYTEAFRLTNTNRSTFKALAEKVGGVIC